MGVKRSYEYYAADFETTVLPNKQTSTEVWASTLVKLFTYDVKIFHSIDETWDYIKSLNQNMVIYYHNLRFDGSFWLNFFLVKLKMKQAFFDYQQPPGYEHTKMDRIATRKMIDNTFNYLISYDGLWYYLVVKINGKIIEFRDSFKLLPFSLKKLGIDFKTPHQKLEMDYVGNRFAGCEIKENEKKYIINDVLVLKEALEIMFEENHTELTIGACCLHEFKQEFETNIDKIGVKYDDVFPNVYDMYLDPEQFGVDNVGRYIWRAYHGGWVYLAKGKENKRFYNGYTLDVNSLYPYVMHSESGSYYPVGKPHFWKGNKIPSEALKNHRFYFIRIKTRFYLKKGMLPWIQIKGSLYYKGTECLESSDRIDPKTGEHIVYYVDWDGSVADTRILMTLTMTDYQRMREFYNLVDFEILDGCWFESRIGLFDEYINHYRAIKENSVGAKRTLAKLFQNNLYGKMAATTESSFKFAYIKDDGTVGFYRIMEFKRTPGYIPIGAAITSYARDYTIRTAQANYYGPDKPGFIFADTDSIHTDLPKEKLKGVRIDSRKLGFWKLESRWDYGIFVRQKTYIEHMIEKNGEEILPEFKITCAGMPGNCKKLLNYSLCGDCPSEDEVKKLLPEQKKFLFDEDGNIIKRKVEDFKKGLKIYGKLMPKMVQGGILLVNTTYELK